MIAAEGGQVIPFFVLVPPRALLLDIAGPMEVVRNANLVQSGTRFTVTYIGVSPTMESSIGLRLADIAPLPLELPDGATVVVSGAVDIMMTGRNDRKGDAVDETEIIRWLARAIRPGIRLVTVCSGALLAARAGLLEGHECTTHHSTLDELSKLAPTARVRSNRLFVEDRERLTSAGVTAGIDLMLAIIAREIGHEAATAVARNLVVYLRRTGADPQLSPWLEGRNHIHPAIHRAQDAIAADPARDWSVQALADVAATSPRNLSRLFNDHTGTSVTHYVNRLRVALARDLITGTRLSIDDIAERAGFASTRQFRRAWGRFNSSAPRHTRAKAATIPDI